MTEQIVTKYCPHCKQIKSVSEFYKSVAQKDGLQPQCKPCRLLIQQSKKGKEYCRNYSQSEKGRISNVKYRTSEKGKINFRKCDKKYRLMNPEKSIAKSKIRNLVNTKNLSKASSYHCRYCWNQARYYHHHLGYAPEHWFDVQPVCAKCHIHIHISGLS